MHTGYHTPYALTPFDKVSFFYKPLLVAPCPRQVRQRPFFAQFSCCSLAYRMQVLGMQKNPNHSRDGNICPEQPTS